MLLTMNLLPRRGCIWASLMLSIPAFSQVPSTLELPNTAISSGTAAYQASNWVRAANVFVVSGSANVVFRAGSTVYLENGFHATAGSSFRALIATPNQTTVAAPSFTPAGGTYAPGVQVQLTAASGATIRYTTDNVNWQAYTTPITVNATKTIQAVANQSGVDSTTASAAYTISSLPITTVTEYIRLGGRVIAIEHR